MVTPLVILLPPPFKDAGAVRLIPLAEKLLVAACNIAGSADPAEVACNKGSFSPLPRSRIKGASQIPVPSFCADRCRPRDSGAKYLPSCRAADVALPIIFSVISQKFDVAGLKAAIRAR